MDFSERQALRTLVIFESNDSKQYDVITSTPEEILSSLYKNNPKMIPALTSFVEYGHLKYYHNYTYNIRKYGLTSFDTKGEKLLTLKDLENIWKEYVKFYKEEISHQVYLILYKMIRDFGVMKIIHNVDTIISIQNYLIKRFYNYFVKELRTFYRHFYRNLDTIEYDEKYYIDNIEYSYDNIENYNEFDYIDSEILDLLSDNPVERSIVYNFLSSYPYKRNLKEIKKIKEKLNEISDSIVGT